MNPSFYKTAQAPSGYGPQWLIRLDRADDALAHAINEGIASEDGPTLYLRIGDEDEARYWVRRFLKVNSNHYEEYRAYTLLVVSVNLPGGLVTFKQDVDGHDLTRYEGLSF